MIGLEDRQALARDIHTAHTAGARLQLACEIAGIDLRTLQRWKARQGLEDGDGRPQAVRPLPSHALSVAERAQLLCVANEARFAAVPPARIVPMLADEGVYLASESSFARVLRANGQSRHRGRATAPHAVRPPTTHIATAPTSHGTSFSGQGSCFQRAGEHLPISGRPKPRGLACGQALESWNAGQVFASV
jgi:putative transposase